MPGFSFAEEMRLLARGNVSDDRAVDQAPDWSRLVAGPWLNTLDDFVVLTRSRGPIVADADIHAFVEALPQVVEKLRALRA